MVVAMVINREDPETENGFQGEMNKLLFRGVNYKNIEMLRNWPNGSTQVDVDVGWKNCSCPAVDAEEMLLVIGRMTPSRITNVQTTLIFPISRNNLKTYGGLNYFMQQLKSKRNNICLASKSPNLNHRAGNVGGPATRKQGPFRKQRQRKNPLLNSVAP